MTMNKEQIRALFEQEAVSFGTCDGVPIRRVAELFGEDAARFADNQGDDGNRNMSVFYAGPYQVHYMTAAGFHRAAAYHNAVEIGKREEQAEARTDG